MSPLSAYFLGLITFILLLLPFWFVATQIPAFKQLYSDSVCWQICSDGTTPTESMSASL